MSEYLLYMLGRKPKSAQEMAEKSVQRMIARRTFLLGAVGLGATFVTADHGIASYVWGDVEDEVNVLPEHENFDSDDLWLVVPGLGVQSSFGIASTLRTSLEITAPVAYMQYSDEGVSLNAIAHQVNLLSHKRKVKNLHIFGNSMGTVSAFALADKLDVKHYKSLIIDGSPHDKYDTQSVGGRNIAELAVKLYEPGYLSKLTGETINSTMVDPNHDLTWLQQLNDAKRVTAPGVSPLVWADQLLLLGNAHNIDFTTSMSELSEVAYVQPNEPEYDRVVKIVQATGKYGNTYEFIKRGMKTIRIDTTSHASPSRFPGQYNQAIGAFSLRNLAAQRNPRLHGLQP